MIRWFENRKDFERCIEQVRPMAQAVETYITEVSYPRRMVRSVPEDFRFPNRAAPSVSADLKRSHSDRYGISHLAPVQVRRAVCDVIRA
jgi:hypothetical protein